MHRIVLALLVVWSLTASYAYADQYRLDVRYDRLNYDYYVVLEEERPIDHGYLISQDTAEDAVLFESSDNELFTDFSQTEIALEATFLILCLIDWAQTKAFRYEGRYEKNPWLGREPSQQKVDTYIPTGMLLHATFTYFLPERLREPFQIVSIVGELDAIYNNHMHGVRISITRKF